MINNSLRVDDEKHDDKHDDGHANDAEHAHEGDAHAKDGHAHEGEWGMEQAMQYWLGTDHLIGHVQDAEYFEWFGYHEDEHGHVAKNKIKIPHVSPWNKENPFMGGETALVKTPVNDFLGPATFQPTKFVVLELVVRSWLPWYSLLMPSESRVEIDPRAVCGTCSTQPFATFETTLRFPELVPRTPSDSCRLSGRFFFFVLALNLIGMVPGLGAATGSISVTAAFALVVFIVVMFTGMKKMGVVGFLKPRHLIWILTQR